MFRSGMARGCGFAIGCKIAIVALVAGVLFVTVGVPALRGIAALGRCYWVKKIGNTNRQ